MRRIEQLLHDWKKEAPDIPGNTCPHIDKVLAELKEVRAFEKDISYTKGRAARYESAEELASDIPSDSGLWEAEALMEQLRHENATLRELGKFWYEKCCELGDALEKIDGLIPN